MLGGAHAVESASVVTGYTRCNVRIKIACDERVLGLPVRREQRVYAGAPPPHFRFKSVWSVGVSFCRFDIVSEHCSSAWDWSFSQFENQDPGWASICTGCPNAAHLNATTSFMFDPELPSYTIGNLRIGLKTNR